MAAEVAGSAHEDIIRVKRIYEPSSPDDGYRVLVDRLWPRGLSKLQAQIDEWARDLAPSAQLRAWFAHDPERFSEFRKRYRVELAVHQGALSVLRERAEHERLTLLYAARDQARNNAVVIAEAVREIV